MAAITKQARRLETQLYQQKLSERMSGMTHEINQPLTAIAQYASGCLLRLSRHSIVDSELKLGLEKIVQYADRTSKLMQRLTCFLTQGTLEKTTVNLNEIVYSVLELVGDSLQAQEIELQLKLADSLPTLQADPLYLEQILLNVINNAVDAMAPTTILQRLLTIETQLVSSEYIELRVFDTGSGISPDIVGQVFQPFITTREKGRGMGLTLTRAMINAHQGSITFSPRYPQGTQFIIQLPRKKIH